MKATMLVGLLQPAPETFDLFDEVILISNGRVSDLGASSVGA